MNGSGGKEARASDPWPVSSILNTNNTTHYSTTTNSNNYSIMTMASSGTTTNRSIASWAPDQHPSTNGANEPPSRMLQEFATDATYFARASQDLLSSQPVPQPAPLQPLVQPAQHHQKMVAYPNLVVRPPNARPWSDEDGDGSTTVPLPSFGSQFSEMTISTVQLPHPLSSSSTTHNANSNTTTTNNNNGHEEDSFHRLVDVAEIYHSLYKINETHDRDQQQQQLISLRDRNNSNTNTIEVKKQEESTHNTNTHHCRAANGGTAASASAVDSSSSFDAAIDAMARGWNSNNNNNNATTSILSCSSSSSGGAGHSLVAYPNLRKNVPATPPIAPRNNTTRWNAATNDDDDDVDMMLEPTHPSSSAPPDSFISMISTMSLTSIVDENERSVMMMMNGSINGMHSANQNHNDADAALRMPPISPYGIVGNHDACDSYTTAKPNTTSGPTAFVSSTKIHTKQMESTNGPNSHGTDVTSQDVIVYRSGQDATAHLGNQIYLCELNAVHEQYVTARTEGTKMEIGYALMKQMMVGLHARFLLQTGNNLWIAMDYAAISAKVFQDLNRKCYVERVSERDVKMGRGGHCSNWTGNQTFLDEKDRMRSRYLAAGANNNLKRQISQDLVDWVYRLGGRFVEQCNDKDNTDSGSKWNDQKWYIVSNEAARKKAMQALREKRRRPNDDEFS